MRTPGRRSALNSRIPRQRADLGHGQPALLGRPEPGRPGKTATLIIDTGNPVRPFITPDDVWAVENILLERAQLASIPHSTPAM
jgi:hypothetical protein